MAKTKMIVKDDQILVDVEIIFKEIDHIKQQNSVRGIIEGIEILTQTNDDNDQNIKKIVAIELQKIKKEENDEILTTIDLHNVSNEEEQIKMFVASELQNIANSEAEIIKDGGNDVDTTNSKIFGSKNLIDMQKLNETTPPKKIRHNESYQSIRSNIFNQNDSTPTKSNDKVLEESKKI